MSLDLAAVQEAIAELYPKELKPKSFGTSATSQFSDDEGKLHVVLKGRTVISRYRAELTLTLDNEALYVSPDDPVVSAHAQALARALKSKLELTGSTRAVRRDDVYVTSVALQGKSRAERREERKVRTKDRLQAKTNALAERKAGKLGRRPGRKQEAAPRQDVLAEPKPALIKASTATLSGAQEAPKVNK